MPFEITITSVSPALTCDCGEGLCAATMPTAVSSLYWLVTSGTRLLVFATLTAVTSCSPVTVGTIVSTPSLKLTARADRLALLEPLPRRRVLRGDEAHAHAVGRNSAHVAEKVAGVLERPNRLVLAHAHHVGHLRAATAAQQQGGDKHRAHNDYQARALAKGGAHAGLLSGEVLESTLPKGQRERTPTPSASQAASIESASTARAHASATLAHASASLAAS